MTFQQVLQSLKQKNYQSVYFLHGPESYFIDTITDYIDEHVLAESEKAFNHTVIYGKEADHKMVVDAARRFPMMASHQVVILKEAQEMKSLKELESYIQRPSPTTILVIAHKHKSFKFNTKFGKLIKANCVVLDAKKLYDNQVPDWIVDYLKSKKLSIDLAAAQLIGEYLGASLSKISNELDKLALNVEAGTQISTQIIEQYIGISKDYNVFELQKAIGMRDVLKANRIIQYFIANPRKNPAPVVLGALYNYFSKVYMLHFIKNAPEQEVLSTLGLRSGFFLKEYRQAARNFSKTQLEKTFATLREYDMKSKGVDYVNTGKAEGAILKEMVWKILHAR